MYEVNLNQQRNEERIRTRELKVHEGTFIYESLQFHSTPDYRK